jgi:UTP--glucose-1-phosphate uridylyltransferase
MKQVKKAIIPAAGMGTRFLPATKAMPKEMLPIVDKPTIQYIVEEAIDSGIEDIIIVTGKTKRSIEDHFDSNFELEENLRKAGKFDLLKKVQHSEIEIHYVRQHNPKGLGHAVWCARKFIGDDPFAVLLGDDIVQAETPGLKQLIKQFDKLNKSVVGVQKVSAEETNRYGIVDPIRQNDRLYEVNKFVEKPALGAAPSNLAIMGRYVLNARIFKYLDQQKIGSGGEVQLTDAIQALNEEEQVYAYDFEGKRYDVGEKLGFVKTTIDFALQHDDLREELLEFLKETLKKEY